jgi:hypothetical protein
MRLLVIGAMMALAGNALAVVITFDESGRADGDILSNQYAGVTFSAGLGGATGVTDPVVTGEGFATNTSLELTTTDIGAGVTAPISGRLLHSFGGWLSEDGDPVIRIDFADPINAISIDFGGVFNPASTGIYAINGSNAAVASAFASATGSSTVSLSGFGQVSSIVVTLGDFGDWVGADNINYTPVPVPEPMTMGALGLGVAALLRRRKK